MDSIIIWLAIVAVFLLGGTVKGVIGGGLPTIGIGLMSLVLPPAEAAALIVLPTFVTNVWQSMGPKLMALLKRIWVLQLGICIGSVFSFGILTGDDAGLARAGLGTALIAYSALGLSKVRFHLSPRGERWLALPAGLATGAIGSATGAFVLPAGPYLQAIGFKKDDLVQALGVTYTVSTVALAAALAHGGAMTVSVAAPSVLALVVALIGMAVGQRIRAVVREQVFLTMFYVGLLLIGLYLILRTVL